MIGAAGYDGRAFRYAKPGVRWFELDHPSTQHDKLARLTRLGVPTGDIRFVAADFASDPVAERLVAAGLDPARGGCSCSKAWPSTSIWRSWSDFSASCGKWPPTGAGWP